jgi:hypothetical protein
MYGRRLAEKLCAAAASIAAVIWFLWGNKSVSDAVSNGLLLGVAAPSFVMMIGLSPTTEGWILTAITILIGIRYGIAALGMSLVAYAIFTVALVAALTIGNNIRNPISRQ